MEPCKHRLGNSAAADQFVFSDAGFDLGLSGASSTPTALPAALFVADSSGGFTDATQRFAYDTGDGKLFFDVAGDTAGSVKELVATLTGARTLSASHLFYIS